MALKAESNVQVKVKEGMKAGMGLLGERSETMDSAASTSHEEDRSEEDDELENINDRKSSSGSVRNYDVNTKNGELTVKVICLGDSAVGKSKLIERFLVNSYKARDVSTYALTLYRHTTTVDSDDVVVDFWDTAGQERFNSIHASYYYQAHACIMVFDATRKITYKNLAKWFNELKSYRSKIPCFCAVNKIDANPNITTKKFAFPTENGIPMYYVSASDGTNVVKLFREAIHAAVKYKKNPTDYSDLVYNELERMQLLESENSSSSPSDEPVPEQ